MPQFLKGYVEKIENVKDGTLSVAIATDSSVDRDGESIDPSGWDFNNFLKNPVLLWAHDYREMPIGKVTDITRDGDRVLFRPQFAIDENPKAKIIFDLFKKGFLNAFSVGFVPREWKDSQGPDGRTVRTFTQTELLEISAVPVPANANAVVLARSYAQEKGYSLKDLGINEEVSENEEVKTESEAETKTNTDLFSEEQKTVIGALIDEKINTATDEIKKALADEISTIKELVAQKGTEDTKVENQAGTSELTEQEAVKRIIQAIDKGINEALRLMKKSN